MEDAQRERLLYRILSGRTRLVVARRCYWLRCPTALERNWAQEIYFETLESSRLEGVPDDEDILRELRRVRLWDDARQKLLDEIEKHIDQWRIKVYENLLRPKEQETARFYLNTARKKRQSLLLERHAWDSHSAQGVALLTRNRFLLARCLLHADNQTPVYPQFDHRDLPDTQPLLDEFLAEQYRQRPGEAELRELARTEPWRSIWTGRQAGAAVLDRPVCDWSEEQRLLVVWTRIYDSAQESHEPPEEGVVEDDDCFDGWMLTQKQKRDADRKNRESNLIGNDRIRQMGEVFVPVSSAEEAALVEKLNSPDAARVKQDRLATIDRQGTVPEAMMPDSRIKIREQFFQKMAQAR